MKISLRWMVGHHKEKESAPVQFVPAEVPGAVQLDWAKAQGWPDYWVGDHFLAYGWMEDVYWTYQTHLDLTQRKAQDEIWFVCAGVDYRFEILLNDQTLFEQEGMFTPIEIDLTAKAEQGDVLSVRVYPPPKSVAAPADRAQANRSCKPAVSYGWDFHPRLIPSGIWQEAALEFRGREHLTTTE